MTKQIETLLIDGDQQSILDRLQTFLDIVRTAPRGLHLRR